MLDENLFDQRQKTFAIRIEMYLLIMKEIKHMRDGGMMPLTKAVLIEKYKSEVDKDNLVNLKTFDQYVKYIEGRGDTRTVYAPVLYKYREQIAQSMRECGLWFRRDKRRDGA